MTRSQQSVTGTYVSSFHTALIHQLLLIALVVVALTVAGNLLLSAQRRRAVAAGRRPVMPGSRAGVGPEPFGRRILRIGFGFLWVLDGLLQVQSGMVLGMPTTVLRPAATGSPGWVHHLVNFGITLWTKHPVEAAASAVWIQLGIGLLLLVAPRGRWSRVAGVVSVGWALVVWVFGEAFGAIFAPGLTWAFGAPGAAVLYAVAGGLLALPERAWRGPRLGRLVSAGIGAFFIGMAVLQAWPGRGFWQGHIGKAPGSLTAMVRAMATTPQPGFLSGWISSFAAFDSAHGWGVNLFLVVALAGIGVGLCTGRPRPVLYALAAAAVLCLADWVLVEDLGFLGGVGTDPNSMLPIFLVIGAGAAALVRQPTPAPEPTPAPAPSGAVAAPSGGTADVRWWERLAPNYVGRVLAAVAAAVVVLVGTVPMVGASVDPNASPIIAEASDGTPSPVDYTAPGFTLTDQRGATVSLASLRGKVVALTFLDPVCTSDCPLIASEFHIADRMLGAQADRVDFVAVVANPIYHSVADTRAFNRQEGLTGVRNWYYLTGSLRRLEQVWNSYGVEVSVLPAGAMVNHSEVAYIIDRAGQARRILNAEPGTTSAAYSSFSSLLAAEIRSVLSS
jgi:cytochrome oxidase Cu insertion factor (SCO1/SenC/PrrC family)